MGKEAYKDIWVFAEQEDGVLSGTTFELLAKAHDLKAKLGGPTRSSPCCWAAVLRASRPRSSPTALEKVIVAENDALAQYSARPYEKALVQLCEKRKPSILPLRRLCAGPRRGAPRHVLAAHRA